MVTPIRQQSYSTIYQSIEQNLAWQGLISGLEADKMLRGKKIPYLYIVRTGELESENEKHYYVSFIMADFSIKHQPFVVWTTEEGWSYENNGVGGPYNELVNLDDVLHLIMHAPKSAPIPLIL